MTTSTHLFRQAHATARMVVRASEGKVPYRLAFAAALRNAVRRAQEAQLKAATLATAAAYLAIIAVAVSTVIGLAVHLDVQAPATIFGAVLVALYGASCYADSRDATRSVRQGSTKA